MRNEGEKNQKPKQSKTQKLVLKHFNPTQNVLGGIGRLYWVFAAGDFFFLLSFCQFAKKSVRDTWRR